MFPHQSMVAARRWPPSRSERSARGVATMPIGTDTRKMSRHDIGASTPPMTRPRKEPAMAAMLFTPSARGGWWAGDRVVEDRFGLGNQQRAPAALPDPHQDQPQGPLRAVQPRHREQD